MSETGPDTCIHATTIAIDGRGVMLVGASGAGKSDLALRLIDRGAVLVSDDYTDVVRRGDAVIASAPPRIAGLIEVRGVGIVEQAFATSTAIRLVVRLGDEIDRMPDPNWCTIAGIQVREVVIDPLRLSAPIKVECALGLIVAEEEA